MTVMITLLFMHIMYVFYKIIEYDYALIWFDKQKILQVY